MPRVVQPLLFLQARLKNKFRHQYLAARRLRVRDDHLSLIISGRKPLTEELLARIERALGVSRADFLPEDHPLQNSKTEKPTE